MPAAATQGFPRQSTVFLSRPRAIVSGWKLSIEVFLSTFLYPGERTCQSNKDRDRDSADCRAPSRAAPLGSQVTRRPGVSLSGKAPSSRNLVQPREWEGDVVRGPPRPAIRGFPLCCENRRPFPVLLAHVEKLSSVARATWDIRSRVSSSREPDLYSRQA